MKARMIRGVPFLFLLAPVFAQNFRVDERNRYERVLAVLPSVGSGSHADPKRPMYAPLPGQVNAGSRTGIIAFSCVAADDGILYLCEFVARDKAAFNQLLADRSIKSFLKGRDKIQDAITEFSKHKKNFDINQFGVRGPLP